MCKLIFDVCMWNLMSDVCMWNLMSDVCMWILMSGGLHVDSNEWWVACGI
jgi:hypothetical protein